MQTITLKQFFELFKDKVFNFRGIPLTFLKEGYIQCKVEYDSTESKITITNLANNINISFRETNVDILFDKDKNLYILKTPNTKSIVESL